MQFQLASMTADSFVQILGEKSKFVQSESQTFSGWYYDTFDWRLYLDGLALFAEEKGSQFTLRLMDRDSGNSELSVVSDQAPGMLDSLPDDGLKDQLASIIEMRRLLPLANIRGERRILRLVDSEEKTLVRLEVVESRLASEDEETVLPLLVNVISLKGYEKESAKLVAWLGQQPDASQGETRHLDEALKILDRKGGDYSSKLNFKLNPDERADAAAKHIMLNLLGTLESNISGTREDIDSEYLHDLRVAVRRTRSALTQIKDVFEPHIVERFKEEFAWIGQITGPTRDMDVYLLKLPKYQQNLPGSFQNALEPFHHYVVDHQAIEQKQLSKQLDSDRFKKILSAWREFLEAPVPKIANPANAVRPVLEVANARIHRMYKRVMKEGKAIHDDTEAEALHELRKSCKKLRYLMEFFQSLYPSKEIKGLIKAIKVLLDNLGDFQDLEVQANKLETMADELRKSRAKTHTLMAMGMLIDDLLKRQQLERERFDAEFKTFSSQENREVFECLFKPAGGVKK